ncbi:MAG: DUF1858 domain-containing protein [Candidatus Thorarchaeota archaeon]|nr:MAG: disulfide oxidoreductase [Candidatus Thorarchaeota archaeon]RLI57918.1 MAG: disulfide oxidoreductase [Candidatus Thorarchaeota archaeon]
MSKQINKEMSITEVTMRWPETVGTFMQHGLHCIGCAAARFETIEQGAMAHGVDPDALIEALNETVEEE